MSRCCLRTGSGTMLLFFLCWASFRWTIVAAEVAEEVGSCHNLRLGQVFVSRSQDRRGHSGAPKLPRRHRLGGVSSGSKRHLSPVQRDAIPLQREGGGLQSQHSLSQRERLLVQGGGGVVALPGLAGRRPLLPGLPCARRAEVLHGGLLRHRHAGGLHPHRHADGGPVGRLRLHRGLLRRPPEPPGRHRAHVQEAAPGPVSRDAPPALRTVRRSQKPPNGKRRPKDEAAPAATFSRAVRVARRSRSASGTDFVRRRAAR